MATSDRNAAGMTEDTYMVVEAAVDEVGAARDHIAVNLLVLDTLIEQLEIGDVRQQLLTVWSLLGAVKQTLDEHVNDLDVIAEPIRHAPPKAH